MAKDLVNVGYKEDFGEPISSKSDNKIRFPHFRLFKSVPDFLMKKDVGDTLELIVKVKVTEKAIEEGEKGKDERLELAVHEVGLLNNSSDKLKIKISKRS